MKIPAGEEPAFPFQCQGRTTGPEIYYGLTKRELIAAMILAVYGGDVKLAIDRADLLIKELSK